MELNTSRIETITPSQFFFFTLSNPLQHDCYLRSPLLRFAVFDSPNPTSDDRLPIVAAMIVPAHRESDWIFSTESGHRHLLLTTCPNHVSRLVLIGNSTPSVSPTSIYVRPPATPTADQDRLKLESELKPFVIALRPKVCLGKELPLPQFLTYEDNILFCVTIGTFSGPVVGEFRVEDVELETAPGSNKKDFRRRLRFKRTPYLIKSEVRITPAAIPPGGRLANLSFDLPTLKRMNQVTFYPEIRVLVPRYLNAMVSAIFLIANQLDLLWQIPLAPRVLCLGIGGGGALLSFLNGHMGFQVVGLDCDRVVLDVAIHAFGLRNDGNSMYLACADAAEWIDMFALELAKNTVGWYRFDVLMVDLDARDGICAPPPNFVTVPVFWNAKSVLNDHGVFVMNVVPLSGAFYWKLVRDLKRVFHKVYKIDVQNEKNMVLAATLSPLPSHDPNNALSAMLRQVIPAEYIRSMKEV